MDIYRRIEGPQFFEINADGPLAEVESRVVEKIEILFPTLSQWYRFYLEKKPSFVFNVTAELIKLLKKFLKFHLFY